METVLLADTAPLLSQNRVRDDSALTQGQTIRKLRRERGLSQMALADLLNVSQPVISYWESGLESMPYHQRMKFVDLLSNRNGELDPFLRRLVQEDPHTSIFRPEFSKTGGDSIWLHFSDVLCQNFQTPLSDFKNQRSSKYINSDWRSTVHGAEDADERAFIEFERDMVGIGPLKNKPAYRLRSKQCVMYLDGHNRIAVSRATIVGPATGDDPVSYGAISLSDIADDRWGRF